MPSQPSDNVVSVGEEGSSLLESNLHPISCKICRKHHKRCDRHLPSCSRCISKGLLCEYNNPQKKGRKKRNQSSEKSSSSPDNETNHSLALFKENYDTSIIVLKRKTIDLYSLLVFHPIPKSQIENWLFLPSSNHHEIVTINTTNNNNTLSNSIPLNFDQQTIDVKALLYSILAVIEQNFSLTNREVSDRYFEISRQLISTVFFQYQNVNVATTYFYLSTYLSANGNHKDALFYLHLLDYCIIDIKDKNINDLNEREVILLKMNQFSHLIVQSAKDVDENGPLTMIRKLGIMFLIATGQLLPNDYLEIQNELNLNNITKHFQAIDLVAKVYGLFLKSNNPNENTSLAVNLMGKVVTTGMKLSCLLYIDNNTNDLNNYFELAIDYSLKITELSEDSFFNHLPPPSLSYFALAAKEHLKFIKILYIDRNSVIVTKERIEILKQKNIDWKGILQKDLRALNILQSKYKRINLFYGDIISEINNIIEVLNSVTVGQIENQNNEFTLFNDEDVNNRIEEIINNTDEFLQSEDLDEISNFEWLL